MDIIKVLVADSSPVFKKMFKSAIEQIDKSTSVSCAGDGKEAADIIIRKNPDIVIIDAEIEKTGLLELLNLIIKETPKAFILVTSRPSSTSAKIFMEALSAGASDSMTKPIYDSYGENFETVKSKISAIIEALRADSSAKKKNTPVVLSKPKKVSSKEFRPQIILFAASTGGPRALETILPALDPDIPVPILIVQHMPPHFIDTLTGRLEHKSKIRVKVADDGEKAVGGTVYMAPGGDHMRLNSDYVLYLDDSPPLNGVRPAADALFESVADDFEGSRILAVILTGMGHDSRKGLIRLKDKKKCYCLAQSERTCVVYGMPRSVVEDGLADKIVDLDQMVQEIESFNYI